MTWEGEGSIAREVEGVRVGGGVGFSNEDYVRPSREGREAVEFILCQPMGIPQ